MSRFAFYGRVSTEDNQDPAASRAWQLRRAESCLPAGAQVVAEYFDIGQSRSLPWRRRPEAARLLADLADPARGWDAIVIGEPQRAFYGSQFSMTFPLITHHQIELWVPEVGGRIDPGSEAHDMVMSIFGGMSKGERMRIKTRVRTAMEAMAATEGRYMGGRPPYGYQLIDTGPHPNPSKAADGKRLRHLEPDPETGPVVGRIFEMYADGQGLRSIARILTAEGVPSPSAADPSRNSHRSGHAWAQSAIRAILTNPRYLGFEVWGRQPKHEQLLDPDDVAAGYTTTQRWASESEWIRSLEPTHEALVSQELWDRAQAVRSKKARAGARQPRSGRKQSAAYAFTGQMSCAMCGHRMHGFRSHGRPGYRCRILDDYAEVPAGHPQTIFIREEHVTASLHGWLSELFDPARLDETVQAIVGARPDTSRSERATLEKQLAESKAAIGRLVEAIEAGHLEAADVGDRIAAHRATIAETEQALTTTPTTDVLDAATVKRVVAEFEGIGGILDAADQDERREFYQALGVAIRFHPIDRTVELSVALQPESGVLSGGVGGET